MSATADNAPAARPADERLGGARRLQRAVVGRVEARARRWWKDARALPSEPRARRLAKRYRIGGGHRRIYFYHIRKTAGTSLCRSLVGLATDDSRGAMERLSRRGGRLILGDKVYVGWNERLINSGHYFCAWSHRPAHALAIPPGTFTITCLRDPVARVISDYRMMADRAQGGGSREFQRKYGGLTSSLSTYVRGIPTKDLLRQIYMFSASLNVEEAAERIVACDHWFLAERFDEGLVRLGEKLDLPLTPTRANQSQKTLEIDRDELDAAREALAPEYRLLSLLGVADETGGRPSPGGPCAERPSGASAEVSPRL